MTSENMTGKNMTGKNLEFYSNTSPTIDIKTYFNGSIKAWGIIQDRKKRVINRFEIAMVGSWDGDTGTLTEHYEYYGGKKQERVWKIKKLSDGSYQGNAPDMVGTAIGNNNGCAINWNYVLDVPVKGKIYRLAFNDWNWAMNDGVLINRSYMKKFGITVAELTVFMQKQ